MSWWIPAAMTAASAIGGALGNKNKKQNVPQVQYNAPANTDRNYSFYQNWMNDAMMNANPNLSGQQSNVTNWSNPWAAQIGGGPGSRTPGLFGQMANAPTAQQGAQSWQNQFGNMMQSGQGINWQNPQLQNQQMPDYLQNFLGGQSGRDYYNPSSLGIGGNVAANVAAGGMPNMGGQTDIARSAQLSGLLGLGNQPGMTSAEMNTMAGAVIDPMQQRLGEARNMAMSDLSARGLGRSTAVNPVMQDYSRGMGEGTQQTYSDLIQQDIGLRNQNRLAGLQGLGEFAGQGMNYQNMGNQFALGQGQLGLGLAGLTQGGGQFADTMNLQGRQQQFGEQQARAGMGSELYQSDAERMLRQYQGDQNYEVSRQGMNQQERQMADDNLLRLLGMGSAASAQDYGQMSDLMGRYLQAGDQNQNAWQTAQNNRIREELERAGIDLQGTQFQGGMAADYLRGLYDEDYRNRALQAQIAHGNQSAAMNQQPSSNFWDFLGNAGNLASTFYNPTQQKRVYK